MHSLTARLRALAALHALALLLLCTACNPQLPSAQDARMGAVVQPSTQTRQGSSGTTTFFSAIVTNVDATSNTLDCGGFKDAWIEFSTTGFVAGTDLVASLEVRGGNSPASANQQELPIDATLTIPLETAYPTGFVVDSGDNGFDFAATYESNPTEPLVAVVMSNVPRYLTVFFDRASGGSTTAFLSATGYCR